MSEHIHFQSYPRIRETHADLTDAQARALGQVEWIATEKIHGANFCILSNGHHVECAKRKALLAASEDFFGYREVIAPLYDAVRHLFYDVMSWTSTNWTRTTLQIAVYGELYGGGYAHPEVVAVDGVDRVQTGVDYCPQIALCGFDIAVQLADTTSNFVFLDFDVARALATTRGLDWVEPLQRGRLTDLLEMNTDFDSTLPARHGLPPLPEGTNLVEGVVLRPAQELEWTPEARPLIKLKSPRFAEDERYHKATNWSARRTHLAPGEQALDRIEWAFFSRLTPPRIQAAISKHGRPGDSDARRQQIIEEVFEDILDDLRPSYITDLLAITHEELAMLRAILEDEVLTMLRVL